MDARRAQAGDRFRFRGVVLVVTETFPIYYSPGDRWHRMLYARAAAQTGKAPRLVALMADDSGLRPIESGIRALRDPQPASETFSEKLVA